MTYIPKQDPELLHGHRIGDKVAGKLLWGDGTVTKGVIIKTDAGISRDAVIIKTETGDEAIMLEQSIERIVKTEND